MRCNKARSYVCQAMDEQLPPVVTRELDEHLDGCEQCREYRADLLMGRRLLCATAPGLPENFDWRLQLKLNQTLQQAVGEVAYPWHDEPRSSRSWLGPFTTAAACGLAAVLSFAIFSGPVNRDLPQVMPGRQGSFLSASAPYSGVSDRLPLTREFQPGPFSSRGGVQRSVSRTGGIRSAADGLFSLDRGWSGNHMEDLMTIQDLRLRNQQLNNQILQFQRQLSVLREHLDNPDSNGLNLGDH